MPEIKELKVGSRVRVVSRVLSSHGKEGVITRILPETPTRKREMFEVRLDDRTSHSFFKRNELMLLEEDSN